MLELMGWVGGWVGGRRTLSALGGSVGEAEEKSSSSIRKGGERGWVKGSGRQGLEW